MDGRKHLIWGKDEAKYFCAYDWTTQISLKSFNKFQFTSMRVLAVERNSKACIQKD
jgi:hypothetical protein